MLAAALRTHPPCAAALLLLMLHKCAEVPEMEKRNDLAGSCKDANEPPLHLHNQLGGAGGRSSLGGARWAELARCIRWAELVGIPKFSSTCLDATSLSRK